MMTHPRTTPTQRLDAIALGILAIRVRRWRWEWPATHGDTPTPPLFVVAFEAQHGPAPGSAERVLARVTGGDRKTDKESFKPGDQPQGPRRTEGRL